RRAGHGRLGRGRAGLGGWWLVWEGCHASEAFGGRGSVCAGEGGGQAQGGWVDAHAHQFVDGVLGLAARGGALVRRVVVVRHGYLPRAHRSPASAATWPKRPSATAASTTRRATAGISAQLSSCLTRVRVMSESGIAVIPAMVTTAAATSAT